MKKNIDIASMSQWELIRIRFRKHRLASLALFGIAGLYAMAILADSLAVNPPQEKDLRYAYAPPMFPRYSFQHGLYVDTYQQKTDPVTRKKDYTLVPDEVTRLDLFGRGYGYRLFGIFPTARHLLAVEKNGADRSGKFLLFGGDKYGRDVFSRILKGARVSLSIGVFAIIVSFVLGVIVGGISGYVGGALDVFIQRMIEILNAFPKLPLWLALGAALPRTWSSLQVYFGITVILSLMGWTRMARVVRGKLLSLREEDYAMAARLLGASHERIIFRHLVPGLTSHIIVSLTMTIPGMILGETSLSFLGLGLKSPTISWGVMLQDCMSMQVVKNYPWILLPVVLIILTVLCFNFVGDGMRDAADPYH
ncbi:MAG: ABC transporter permease [Lentisphaeria bacterium]|nr:ABC transporter permease [Lentisphaeria bacterium]